MPVSDEQRNAYKALDARWTWWDLDNESEEDARPFVRDPHDWYRRIDDPNTVARYLAEVQWEAMGHPWEMHFVVVGPHGKNVFTVRAEESIVFDVEEERPYTGESGE